MNKIGIHFVKGFCRLDQTVSKLNSSLMNEPSKEERYEDNELEL